jgi:predicted MFS family arabinose efflux permease
MPGEREAVSTSEPEAPHQSIRREVIFIGYAAFITTLAQGSVLGNLPIRLLLKNHFDFTRTELSEFLFWAGLAWYFKPVVGLAVDAILVLGTRRRWYMIGSAILGGLTWLMVGVAARNSTPHHVEAFLGTTMLLSGWMVVASTVMGALLVEAGQRYRATGRLSALREAVQNSCLIITGPVGGFLATRSFGLTATIGAGLLFSLAVVAVFGLHERPVATGGGAVWKQAGRQLRVALASRPLWAAMGLLLLFFFSPGLATPLLYRQQNLLHFGDQLIGILTMVDGIFLVVGSLLYGWLCRRFPLRRLLPVGLACAGSATLLYLNYHPSATGAIVIEAVAQFLGAFGALPLYDLATRATPAGGEAMGYALMMSSRNVAVFASDILGSWLLDHHLPWNALVGLNSGTTLLCLLVVPLLPRALTRVGDAPLWSQK